MKEHALHDCMQRAVAEFNLRTVEILRDYLATIGKKFSIPEMQRRFVRVCFANALNLAMEACQVAAVCQKILDGVEEC